MVWQQRLNLPDDVLLHSVVMQQKSAEGQSDKMVPDMQVHMKQRYITESSVHAKCLWKPKSGCEHSEVVGGAVQQW